MKKKWISIVLGCMTGVLLSTTTILAQETQEPVADVQEVEPTPSEEVSIEPTEVEPEVQPEVEPETEPEVEPVVEPEPVVLNGWQDNNTKYYVDNVAVNGVQKIGNDYYLFQNETLKSFTGVVKNSEGQWIHLKNGKSDFNFTGFSKSIQNDKWYFSRNGKLDWNFTGVAKSVADNKWYHAKNGALDWNFTGLSKSVQNNKWYFSRKGALDWSFTGVAKSVANNKWYHAKNGALDWTFTGISKSVADGSWYVSRNGELDWSFTGVAKSIANNKWYYASKGKLDWSYTGLGKSIANNKLYYVKKGSLDWSKNGYTMDPNTGAVYRVKNGEAQYHSNIKNDLRSILNQTFGANPNVAVGLYDLTNDMKLEMNEARMPSASVIKLYIAGAVCEMFPNVSAATESNLSAMLLYSDNTAANNLISLLGNGNYQRGFQVVNQYCAKHGYNKTHLGRALLAPNYYDDNYTSVGDSTKFVSDIYHNRIPGSKKILNYMHRQYFRTKIPGGIPYGILVGNKTGEVPGVENDVAIIYGSKRTYVLSVMVKGVTSPGTTQGIIRNLSSRIYHYLNA